MLKISTREDLERLVKDGVKESLTLDYKQSLALSKEDRKKDELCKDVTAFANSAGGQLIFGIEEDKQVPIGVDDGAAPEITKEWIEHVDRLPGATSNRRLDYPSDPAR
jgi:predicted HTH transcriptional regulator